MTREVYLTGCGAYLPGEPLDNDEIARRLGAADSSKAARERVLAANGIRTRHYALDASGATTMLNEELAAEAVTAALKDRGVTVADVTLLATGTTQPDLPVPGFASMVHGRLGGHPMEILSAGGVCASGMAALHAAVNAVRVGEHDTAVAVGSDLVSRALRQSRYDAADGRTGFDAEFLRWTLSDGAGAVVVEGRPRPDGPSLRLDWLHHVSYAHEERVCMRTGTTDGGVPAAGTTWLDQPTAAAAEKQGSLLLRQDVRSLPRLFQVGLREYAALVRDGRLDPPGIDHVLCHYSAEHFRGQIFTLLREANLMIDEERWFTNLHTRGNTGAASIFVMLEEAWRTNRFAPGEKILLIVPESGRFSFAFAQLTCVGPETTPAPSVAPVAAASPLGIPGTEDDDAVRWAVLELGKVWDDFARRLAAAPIIRRIESNTATLDDYRKLLLHLRQQVIDGGRWIARAASSFSAELFELRSAAIRHAAEEHRDFRLLERDYVAVGGDLETIQNGRQNVGSEALSAFLFHRAGLPDPVDLMGAMFIIEGLGTACADRWASLLREQLGLTEEQTSFLHYHGGADAEHFEMLTDALRSGIVTRSGAERIVRTAAVTARLYALQLEAIDDE
ncbi:3-oxoacyl-[acyl-carrier-protein] synthase III C-terminal domain-containing protein [Luedemannella flava]